MLIINGTIAAESWLDDDVTPKIFKEELLAGKGDVTVWINTALQLRKSTLCFRSIKAMLL